MSYQRVQVDPNSLVIDPNLIPLYSQPVLIAMPSFTYIRDRRDNPIDSTRGSYTALGPWHRDQRAGLAVEFHAHCWSTIRPTTRSRKTGCWRGARKSASNVLTARTSTARAIAGDRHSACPNCSSPAAAIRCAASPSTRPDRAIPTAATPSADRGCSSITWRFVLRRYSFPSSATTSDSSSSTIWEMSSAAANQILSGITRLHQPSLADCAPPNSTVACNFSYNPQAIGMGIRYKTPIGPVRFDLALQLQSHSLSHSRTGQSHVAAAHQLLFQYWTNFLMRRHYCHFRSAFFHSLRSRSAFVRGRSDRRRCRHRQPQACFAQRMGRGRPLRGLHAAEATGGRLRAGARCGPATA